jgi:putative membrane protein
MDTLVVISLAWRWSAPGLFCCIAALALYAILTGFRPTNKLAWFLAGDVFLAVVACSPLDLLARQYLFTAEALERVLIGLLAAYLFVLGAPEKSVRGLHLDRLRVSSYITWITGMAALSMWYLPRLQNAALTSDAVRCLEYATLIAGGAVFWWPLHSPLREQRIPLLPNSLLYLAAATVWCSLIGLFVAFGPPWSSSHYLRSIDTLHISDSLTRDWSFTRETDQETAGLLFWISSATLLLTEVMLVYYRWYISSEVRNESTSNVETVRPPHRPGVG